MDTMLTIGNQLASLPGQWLALCLLTLLLLPVALGVLLARQRAAISARQIEQVTQAGQLQLLQHLNEDLEEKVAALEERIGELEQARTSLQHAAREAELLDQQRDKLEIDNRQLRQDLSLQREKYAELQARSQAERQSLDEKIQLLQENRQSLVVEFENLSNRIFDEKQKNFSAANKQMLDGTLSPFKEQLKDFRKKVDDTYHAESRERHVLKEQIVQLRQESLRISEDANNLTQALRHDNKAQGNWGELTLVRALEVCGLKQPEEYETQIAIDGEDGDKKRIPDVIVHLPGGKDIIIDSKVSLLAYSRYFEAETDEERQAALQNHLQSVRQHIKDLSSKSYEKLPGVNTLDYVMLYIPIEGASTLALQSQRDLWEEAYSKNIVLVSPTNLLAILRSVETIWRHEKQNKNAEEIARQAGNLHDKFVGMVKSLEGIEKGLDAARNSYDKVFSQLSRGRGNLVTRVKNLEKLGAKTKNELPQNILQAADHDDEDYDSRFAIEDNPGTEEGTGNAEKSSLVNTETEAVD